MIICQSRVSSKLYQCSIATGIIKPRRAFANWPDNLFNATKKTSLLNDLIGDNKLIPHKDISVTAPSIAENGAAVPVTVKSAIKNMGSLHIVVADNPTPLIVAFNTSDKLTGRITTRMKMQKFPSILAIVNEDPIMTIYMGTGISKNPFLSFDILDAVKGDTIEVRWTDNSDSAFTVIR